MAIGCHGCPSYRAAEATAAEARRKYEAAKLAADEAERARLAAESLSQEAQARESRFAPHGCNVQLQHSLGCHHFDSCFAAML